MIRYLDSAVLVASLIPDDPDHAACDLLLRQSGNLTSPHALNETFATLTGGRLGLRVDAGVAARLIRESVVPCLSFVPVEAPDIIGAQSSARSRGARGGGIYDLMHLAAAAKAGAEALYTLDQADFVSIHRPGDPEIRRV